MIRLGYSALGKRNPGEIACVCACVERKDKKKGDIPNEGGMMGSK
jgi:hypothetical protein